MAFRSDASMTKFVGAVTLPWTKLALISASLEIRLENLVQCIKFSGLISCFTVAKGKSHATKRCNPRLCSSYRFWDIVVANIKNFKIFHFYENLLERNRESRRTSSYGLIIRIKKYRVQGSCFRLNISKTVRDIWVPFSLWPRTRVTLPNGATHVSVVVIVSEI